MAVRLLGAVVAATVAAGIGPAGPVIAAPAGEVPVIVGATKPSLTSFGRDGLLLLADGATPVNASNTALLARASGDGCRWGSTVRLGSVSPYGLRAVALNGRGEGAVMWSQVVGQGGRTYVRLRHANGSWAAPYRIPHAGFGYAGSGTVAVNAGGTVVAITPRGYGRSFLSIHRPGGRWSRVQLPRVFANPTSMAVDRRGGIHLTEAFVPRGGAGTVYVGYRSPSGRWSSARARVGSMVEDARLLVTPAGAETLVVGRASRRWMSTFDTEAYWSTQYSVFRRTTPKARWREVWHRMGATGMIATASNGRVRLLWTQLADRNQHHSPATLRLQTRGLAKGAEVHTLATQRTNLRTKRWDWGADFATALALGPKGCQVEVWRADAEGQTYGGLLTSLTAGHGATYPDPTPARADLEAATVCANGGHAFLARTANQKLDIQDDGQYVVGGDVMVSRLR